MGLKKRTAPFLFLLVHLLSGAIIKPTGIDSTTGRYKLWASGDAIGDAAAISSQAGAPASTPSQVGNINVDTTADRMYISTDTASSADWDIILTPSSTDTLTNKLISGASNTLSAIPVSALANGTDGQLITWDSSGVAATVSTGNSGQVLTSNGAGTAPTFQTPTVGGGVVQQIVVTMDGTEIADTSQSPTIPEDDTIPQLSEFEASYTGLNTTITASSATNKFLIEVDIPASGTHDGTGEPEIVLGLFMDSETSARAVKRETYTDTDNNMRTIKLVYQMTTGDTSAHTFKIYYGRTNSNSNMYFNRTNVEAVLWGGTLFSTMKIMEYTP